MPIFLMDLKIKIAEEVIIRTSDLNSNQRSLLRYNLRLPSKFASHFYHLLRLIIGLAIGFPAVGVRRRSDSLYKTSGVSDNGASWIVEMLKCLKDFQMKIFECEIVVDEKLLSRGAQKKVSFEIEEERKGVTAEKAREYKDEKIAV
ncbi:hypothetical protein BDN72DRAFT_858812 [Pluteus cervinus]|uniref:Uncharacterized protein n=1 Tax=Pluteus cervinus TaxID=181527 RepID=A0ACD3AQM6_9AGAR|nr:hypothetical protein BDN72DRAFT_858812 [Pluteus cervinus]